jgi:hypothetical protein
MIVQVKQQRIDEGFSLRSEVKQFIDFYSPDSDILVEHVANSSLGRPSFPCALWPRSTKSCGGW